MQSTQPDLAPLRSAARERGFEIDLSSGHIELFQLTDPHGVTFAGQFKADDERAEPEARQWLECSQQ